MKKTSRHIMVDIETLSTAKNAVVLSIGAVEFDVFTGEIKGKFYRQLKLDEQSQRHISMGTLQWWAKQRNDGCDDLLAISDEDKASVTASLLDLLWFIYGSSEKDFTQDLNVWACDPDFDLEILSTLYQDVGLKAPWSYYETRSVRTIRSMAKTFGISQPKLPVSHNALDDCIRQVAEISPVYADLAEVGA